MTPKEKAEELVYKIYQTTPNETCFSPQFETGNIPYKAWEQAKQCALIAVDEILNYDLKAKTESQFIIERRIEEYWEQVKQEIENL